MTSLNSIFIEMKYILNISKESSKHLNEHLKNELMFLDTFINKALKRGTYKETIHFYCIDCRVFFVTSEMEEEKGWLRCPYCSGQNYTVRID